MAKAGLFQDDLLTSDYGASRNLFGQEKAAMYLMGSWEMGLPTDQNFPQSFRDNVGAFKVPGLKSGKGTAADQMAWFGGNYMVSAKSKYKDLGVDYLKFYFKRFPRGRVGRRVPRAEGHDDGKGHRTWQRPSSPFSAAPA